METDIIGDEAADEVIKDHKNSLWHIAKQNQKDKAQEEDRILMREIKDSHNESAIETRRRINELRAEKEDFDYAPMQNPGFSIGGENTGGLTGSIGKIKIWLKKKKIGLKRRTEINYIDCIHISPKLNAVFLTGAFTDKYNQVYEADREYVKRYNKTKVINVFMPDGRRGKAVYNYDILDENIEIKPLKADESVLQELQDIEEGRDRLFIDDQTRVNIEMDDRQLKILLLAVFLSGAMGFMLSTAVWVFILFSGLI